MKKVFCFIAAVIILVPFLSGCTTYVQAPRAEVVGVAPYPGAVWVPGHYGPYGGWHPGHWRGAY
jgi:hypothetical protein